MSYGKKKKRNINELHIFGEEVFTHIPKEKRQKWDAKAQRGFFVGYEENVKGYRVWYPEMDTIRVVRDIIFTGNEKPVIKQERNNNEIWIDTQPNADEDENKEEDIPEEAVQDVQKEPIDNTNENEDENSESDLEINEIEEVSRNNVEDEEIPPNRGRQLRNRNTLRRPNRYENYVDIDDVFLAQDCEPVTYKEAMESNEASKWKDAMKDEMRSLSKNEVWELTEAPKGKDIMDNRWIFRIKRDKTGNVQRYKARLVARGFRQKQGIDYQETFSPVVRFDSLRAILAIAAREKMKIQQFDVKTAFLYGDIEESIYMKQPEGFTDGTERVCKLKRSLYGLKQSSRCWNRKFTDFLKKFGLKALDADACIYRGPSKLILAIYIDDGLIIAKDQESIDQLLWELGREFEITTENSNMFLGLQIEPASDGSIFVHQENYIRKKISLYRMEDANPVTIPADPNDEQCTKVHLIDQNETTQAPYRQAIGSLMYLSIATRPDITFAVNRASRYMEKPSKIHWNAVKRIMKYLKGTMNYGLLYDPGGNVNIKAYSDADYAGDLETRRSTTGYVVKLGTSVISWNSQRQRTVALSTTDAEYMAACQTVKEIVWVKRLLEELTNSKDIPTALLLDNMSAIQLIKNPVFHKRTKHIDVRYHYIREKYQEKVFSIEYVSTKKQLADVLTKPLSRNLFQSHRDALCSPKEHD